MFYNAFRITGYSTNIFDPGMDSDTFVCELCGGKKFTQNEGQYFCDECQTQSQHIGQEQQAAWAPGVAARHSLAQISVESQEYISRPVDSKEVTSWEVLNLILKGLVEELILLGAPILLRQVALQLWASYLIRLEVAFISKHIGKKPRLGVTFRRKDAELVYGTPCEAIRAYKRPIHRAKRTRTQSGSSSDQTSVIPSSTYVSKRSRAYKQSKKRSSLAASEGNISTQGSEMSFERFPRTRSPATSQKSYKLRYSSKAKSILSELLDTAIKMDEEQRHFLQSRILRQESLSVHHVAMTQILSILRIALLILESDIHLGDLLRWSDEGYLSWNNADKLVPPGVSVGRDVKAIFVTILNSRCYINRSVFKLSKFLDTSHLSVDLIPLVQRYCRELHLPDDLVGLVKRLISLRPPKMPMSPSVNYEGRALAYIIFALKYLLGLDGVTEHQISRVATLINKRLSEGERRLFNWTEWTRYVNCRNAVVSYHHQTSRDYHYPGSRVGGSSSFISHWDKIPARQTLQRRHVIDKKLCDTLRSTLRGLTCRPLEPLPPSLCPMSNSLPLVLARDSSLSPGVRRILKEDFTLHDIEYLLDEQRQTTLSESYNFGRSPSLGADILLVKAPELEKCDFRPSSTGNRRVTVTATSESKKKKNENQFSTCYLKEINLGEEKLLKGNVSKSTANKLDRALSSPLRGYWTYHGKFSDTRTQSSTVEHIISLVFPPDFVWLLKECARLGKLTTRDLYGQLTAIEKMYLEYIPKKKKANPRSW